MARVRWNEVMRQTVPIVKSFIDRGIVPTVRTVYYALVSKELIPNTRSAYQGLCKKLRDARKNGVISWEHIADETRVTRGSDHSYWEPDEYAKAYVDHLIKMLQNFELPRWLNQEYYVEVWIEKFALASTFDNWLGDMNIVLVPSRGYASWTFLKKGAERISKQLYDVTDNPLIAKYQGRDVGLLRNDRKAVILYFGDFDPSGKDIERFIKESLEWFGVSVEMLNIAVTKDQIERYNLPSKPEDAKEIAKLMRDPRYKKWEHGLFRVELDALMAFVPDKFERMIKDSVAEYFDEDVYKETIEQEEEDKKTAWDTAKKLLDEKIEEFKEEE